MKIGKFLSCLGIGLYAVSSLSCITVKASCCSQGRGAAHSCHVPSRDAQRDKNQGEGCCCSFASDIPKSLQSFFKILPSILSFMGFSNEIKSPDIHKELWGHFLGPPGPFRRDFSIMVFPSHAPPLAV